MPVPRSDHEDLREFALRDPEDVLDEDLLYTIPEIARLLQGLAPDRELPAEVEERFLLWAVPWMLDNQASFVFAEPTEGDEAGLFGLR
jgi:hypothetical protein